MDSGKVSSDYELYGHRQVGAAKKKTECPGDNLYKEIKTWEHWVSCKEIGVLFAKVVKVLILTFFSTKEHLEVVLYT